MIHQVEPCPVSAPTPTTLGSNKLERQAWRGQPRYSNIASNEAITDQQLQQEKEQEQEQEQSMTPSPIIPLSYTPLHSPLQNQRLSSIFPTNPSNSNPS